MVVVAALAAMLATLASTPASIPTQDSPVAVAEEIPEVLRGDTWLRHHREDLMPYWDRPEALGEPLGNFPSFRGPEGELLPESPESTVRGVSTLARQVYGYSHAFMMTGEDRYLTYAKAGLDWINTKAKDPVYGGYYGRLKINGHPVDPYADKNVFDLASLGLAYGMYFNVTRDPAAEAGLLAVRDLIFDKYYDPATNRVKDALSRDLLTEVDTGGNGGDITDLLVPGTPTVQRSGNALLAGLSSQAIVRVVFDGTHAREVERYDMGQRIRELEQHPDGSVYVLEDERDGSGGRLLMLVPRR